MDYLQYWKDMRVQRGTQPIKISGDGKRTLHNVFLDGTQIGFHVVEMIETVIAGKKRKGELVAFLGFDQHADQKDCATNADQLLEKGNFLRRTMAATPAPILVTPASAPAEQAVTSEVRTDEPSDKAAAKSKRPGGKKARKAASKKTGGAKMGADPASQPAAMQ